MVAGFGKTFRIYEGSKERGIEQKPDQKTPNWRLSELPGKCGFDTVDKVLGSKVESRVAEYMSSEPSKSSSLTSCYIWERSITCRICSDETSGTLTREVAIIEAEAIPVYEVLTLCEFFETNELNYDMSNWWSPNKKALLVLCRAARFRHAEIIVGAPAVKKQGVSVFRHS